MLKAKTSKRDSAGKVEAMRTLQQEGKVRLNLDIERSTMRELKQKALVEDSTVSDIVRNLVSEYLSK
jgi:hypothetical protein